MYKIFSGILKKVPTEEMFEKSIKNEVDLKTITFEDTIRITNNDKKSEYLLFRLSYQEATGTGQAKYILNEETQEFEKVYRMTPIIAAYNKELRIICELGEYHPVKIIAIEKEKNGKRFYDAICVQDQLKGVVN
ncbi:MAG: hypothetical protein ACK5HR_05715 [Mycoplasmatales bacterium]